MDIESNVSARTKTIFLNYRREDTGGYAGRLYDCLNARFPGQVFMDLSGIEPGADFVSAIEETVGACAVLIVLIGENWLSAAVSDGYRRLDDPQDILAREIEIALTKNIKVIPALVNATAMPAGRDLPPGIRALARRNALHLTDQDWRHDIEQLIVLLQQVVSAPEQQAGAKIRLAELAGHWQYRETRAGVQNDGTLCLAPTSEFTVIDSIGVILRRGKWEFDSASATLKLFDPDPDVMARGIGFQGELQAQADRADRFLGRVNWLGDDDAWSWEITRQSQRA